MARGRSRRRPPARKPSQHEGPAFRLLCKDKDTGDYLEYMAFWPSQFADSFNGSVSKKHRRGVSRELAPLTEKYFVNLYRNDVEEGSRRPAFTLSIKEKDADVRQYVAGFWPARAGRDGDLIEGNWSGSLDRRELDIPEILTDLAERCWLNLVEADYNGAADDDDARY